MTHAEFTAAFSANRLRVDVDRKLAAQIVSGRMMLPVFLLPVIGLAIALALLGHWIWGLVLFAAGFGFRQMVRNSAPGFILKQAIGDPAFYEFALRSRVLSLIPVDPADAPQQAGAAAAAPPPGRST
jgi:hypothetical protein